jgi:hypothetical protein
VRLPEPDGYEHLLATFPAPIIRRLRDAEELRLLTATVLACAALVAGCTSGDRSASLDDLGKADTPYYYVGWSFDGFELSHVERYRDDVASILYGTCDAPSDGGCPPPLELQHTLCHGRVRISIFVGQGAKRGSARRAAAAPRPLSKGARKQTPDVVFDTGVAC